MHGNSSRLNLPPFPQNLNPLPPKNKSPTPPPICRIISDPHPIDPQISFSDSDSRAQFRPKMDSDDDFQSFSPLKETSPDVHYRRLKRLKRSNSKPSRDPLPEPFDDPLLLPDIDFARLEALENGTVLPDSNDSNSTDEAILSQESLSQGIDVVNETNDEDKVEGWLHEEVKKTKRMLEFDDDAKGGVDENEWAIGEDSEAFEPAMTEKEKIIEEEDLFEGKEINSKKNKTKKRVKTATGDGSKPDVRGSNKRREEKERKAYLKELHAESQRLLRETRDASFKPIPVVHKPISSVLEKIRKRKLEISKKAMVLSGSGHEPNISPRDKSTDLDLSNKEKGKGKMPTIVEKEIVSPSLEGESDLAVSDMDEFKDTAKETTNENDKTNEPPNEEPTPAFRAPVDDTQDLFDDAEPNCAPDEQNHEQPNSPLEEDFAPSLLDMNLKFDSAPVDDSSSDEEEEDNDKENIAPRPRELADASTSARGDPVKDFVDEEAEEEDDSDNDLNRFPENEEDEDIEDSEELNDMIATEYKERPVDGERRNELHQKWLEQQDAAGTDNIMQRLKCGLGLRDTFLHVKESETDEEEDEEFDDEAKDDSPLNPTRVNTKKAKQIILQMLSDKEDVYLSDGEDDTHSRNAHRLLIRKEEQASVVSPADDESSREVFGLIKKLNIVSENKRKPKASSFFDSMLKGGNSNVSSKSSFLGRVSSHSISSSRKQGSGSVRSFIFGRDDSNSRSSVSISEDSSDTVSGEIRTSRTITAKYSSSKNKFSSQTREGCSEAVSKTSLLEILKRSKSQVCNKDSTVDLTKSILAFRVPKKPMKIEGRS